MYPLSLHDALPILAEQHARHKVAYLAAPVFGRPEAAAARRLWICLSGQQSAKQRVQPILAAVSQGIFDFAEDPGAANVVKLCGNFLIAAAIVAFAEARTLSQKCGLVRNEVSEFHG